MKVAIFHLEVLPFAEAHSTCRRLQDIGEGLLEVYQGEQRPKCPVSQPGKDFFEV